MNAASTDSHGLTWRLATF